MINKKSFDLNKDEKNKKSLEKFYQPKKFCWCKYIVLPTLVGFIFLLILTNGDFVGDVYENTWLETESNKFKLSLNNLGQTKFSLTTSINCEESSDGCSFICKGGNDDNVYEKLQQINEKCSDDIVLTLRDYTFPEETLKPEFFEGNFQLKELNIINCNLSAIQDNAFRKDSVKNLKSLFLTNTQFMELNEFAFAGLENLDYFYLINDITANKFKGYKFLEPLSQTLTKLKMIQKSKTYFYDPLEWLQGFDLIRAILVDFSDNNFQDNLNNKTFSTLVAVEELLLANCKLNYLPSNTFDSILISLKHLDLSNNQLHTLSVEMLINMNDINLNLGINSWDCSCDNEEMLEIIQNNKNNTNYLDRDSWRCVTPLEKYGEQLENVPMNCDGGNTGTTDFDTTEDSGMSTTNEIGESTTVEKTETTHTTMTIRSTSPTTTFTTTTGYSTSTTNATTESPTYTSTTSAPTTNATTKSPTYTTSTPSYGTTLTTTSLTTTTKTTPGYVSTTTIKPTLVCTTTPPLTQITCLNSHYSLVYREKCKFSMNAISKTSVIIILSNFLSNIEVLYFTNSTNSNELPARMLRQQEHSYSILINNLDPNMAYVFCLIYNKQQFISPFDCQSYYGPYVLPQPWILNDDKAWIISVVVLGSCLALFLTLIFVVLCLRLKRRSKNIPGRKASKSSDHSNVTSIPLENFCNVPVPSNSLHHCPQQTTNVTNSSNNIDRNDDSDDYIN